MAIPDPMAKQIDLRSGDRVDRAIDAAKVAFCGHWPWFWSLWLQHEINAGRSDRSNDELIAMLPDEPFERAMRAFLARLALTIAGGEDE